MKLEVKITDDKSHTLFVPELKEHYHSTYGAIQESQHIYINAGMHCSHKNPLTIFEMGFGTGLNAYLTYLKANKNKIQTFYYSIEKFPLDLNIVSKLNYPHLIGNKFEVYNKMHECKWNELINLSPYFQLLKIKADIKKFIINFRYDVVYFDAFGPDVQPCLWKKQIFEKIINSLNTNGIFITYSAKGEVKRNLKNLNMKIETIPGPKGKREIIRAFKT